MATTVVGVSAPLRAGGVEHGIRRKIDSGSCRHEQQRRVPEPLRRPLRASPAVARSRSRAAASAGPSAPTAAAARETTASARAARVRSTPLTQDGAPAPERGSADAEKVVVFHAQAHHELDLGALAERPPARPLARTDVHDPPAGRHQPGARPLPRHELPWRCEIRTSCEAGLREPALELLALDVRGGRSGELVEDNAVVLAEAEVGHARHVLVQRERPPGTRVLERSVHALRDAVERDGERPGDGAQRGARQLRREPAEGLDGVPHEAVVLEAVEPHRDRPPGPQIAGAARESPRAGPGDGGGRQSSR